MKAIVLLSGGLDSATAMAIAKDRGYELYAISFRYGQRHIQETECAEKLAKHYNVKELEASVSIAAFRKDWNPFKVIQLILSLFFKDSCYNRLTAVTHPSNRQAVRLVKLAGFTLEGILRKPVDVENIMQFSILREDWEVSRWAIY